MSRGAGEAGAWRGKGGPPGAGVGDVGGSPVTRMFVRRGLFSKVGSGFAGRKTRGIATGGGMLPLTNSLTNVVVCTGRSAPVEL